MDNDGQGSRGRRRAPSQVAGLPVGQVVELGGMFEERDGRAVLTPLGALTVQLAVSFMAHDTVALFRVCGEDVPLARCERTGERDAPTEWVIMPGTEGESSHPNERLALRQLVECLETLAS